MALHHPSSTLENIIVLILICYSHLHNLKISFEKCFYFTILLNDCFFNNLMWQIIECIVCFNKLYSCFCTSKEHYFITLYELMTYFISCRMETPICRENGYLLQLRKAIMYCINTPCCSIQLSLKECWSQLY